MPRKLLTITIRHCNPFNYKVNYDRTMITSAPKPRQRTNEPPYKVTEITTYTQIKTSSQLCHSAQRALTGLRAFSEPRTLSPEGVSV